MPEKDEYGYYVIVCPGCGGRHHVHPDSYKEGEDRCFMCQVAAGKATIEEGPFSSVQELYAHMDKKNKSITIIRRPRLNCFFITVRAFNMEIVLPIDERQLKSIRKLMVDLENNEDFNGDTIDLK